MSVYDHMPMDDELANPGAESPGSKLPATPAPPALEHSHL